MESRLASLLDQQKRRTGLRAIQRSIPLTDDGRASSPFLASVCRSNPLHLPRAGKLTGSFIVE